MSRRALLLGGEPTTRINDVDKTLHVDQNLALVEELLRELRFDEVESIPRASRAVLLKSLDSFVERLSAGDVGVVYFAGHGGLVRFADEVPGVSKDHIWRYLVPADPEHSRADFRGVLDVELFEGLGYRAADRCASVTLILESCYAGGMIKPFDVLTGARGQSIAATVEVADAVAVPAGLRELAARYAGSDSRDRAPDDLIVVSATTEARAGHEQKGRGVFTDELCRVLREYKDTPVGWGRVIDEVALGVQARRRLTNQLPVLVGSRRRQVFGVSELDDDTALVARCSEGELWMLGGKLQGFADDDRVALLDVNDGVATLATITAAALDVSRIRPDDPTLADNHYTAVLREPAWRMAVALDPELPELEQLRASLRESAWLRAAAPGKATDAAIVVEGGRACLSFPNTARLRRPELRGRERIAWLVDDLEALARSQWLLDSLADAPEPPDVMECWVRVNGDRELKPGMRELLRRDRDRINCGLRYAGGLSSKTMFVHILDRRVCARLGIVKHNVYAPGGFNLFSEVPDHARGLERTVRLEWSDDVPLRPMFEKLLFVFTSRPVNFHALLEPSQGKGVGRDETGVLARRLQPLQCFVKRFEFELDPGAPRSASVVVPKLPDPTRPAPLPSASRATRARPRRRALLLGAEAPDLRGVARDLELMDEALRKHGFDDIVSVRPATRDAIRAALDGLVAETRRDDVALLYYSGHGVQIERPRTDPAAITETNFFRFIVPSDFEQSTAEDFRVLTTIELSTALERLETENVIAIMDCCFAGTIFRADDRPGLLTWQVPGERPIERALALPNEFAEYAARHFDWLGAALGPDRRHPEANPHAVRLLASSATGQAFEATVTGGSGYAGALTRSLHRYLLAANPWTTWQELGRALRCDPRGWTRGQTVSIEGPHRRYLFRVEEREELGVVEVKESDEGVVLVGGALIGLAPGDRYELLTQSVRAGLLQPRILGVVTVAETFDSYARVEGEIELDESDAGCWARPIAPQPRRASVELLGLDDRRGKQLLRARFAQKGLVDLVEPGQASFPVIGRVEAANGRVQLHGRGLAFDRPQSFDVDVTPHASEQLAEQLARNASKLARVERLLTLADSLSSGAGNLAQTWELSWVRVTADGRLEPLAASGAEIEDGESVTVRIRDARATVFASIFWCRPDAGIEQLSTAQSGGVEVSPNGDGYAVGQRSGGPIRGYPLRCPSPSSVADPADGLLSSSLVVIVTDRRVDLRAWAQPPIEHRAPGDPLKLESTIRNVGKLAPPPVLARYRIARFDFSLRRRA